VFLWVSHPVVWSLLVYVTWAAKWYHCGIAVHMSGLIKPQKCIRWAAAIWCYVVSLCEACEVQLSTRLYLAQRYRSLDHVCVTGAELEHRNYAVSAGLMLAISVTCGDRCNHCGRWVKWLAQFSERRSGWGSATADALLVKLKRTLQTFNMTLSRLCLRTTASICQQCFHEHPNVGWQLSASITAPRCCFTAEAQREALKLHRTSQSVFACCRTYLIWHGLMVIHYTSVFESFVLNDLVVEVVKGVAGSNRTIGGELYHFPSQRQIATAWNR